MYVVFFVSRIALKDCKKIFKKLFHDVFSGTRILPTFLIATFFLLVKWKNLNLSLKNFNYELA